MNINCNDRERIFLDGTPEEWAELEAHAANCAACGDEVRSWKNLSIAAADLHQEWDAPVLWPRIEQALKQNPAPHDSGWRRYFIGWNSRLLQWQTAAAALLLVALTGSAIWVAAHPGPPEIPPDQALLNDATGREGERGGARHQRGSGQAEAQDAADL